MRSKVNFILSNISHLLCGGLRAADFSSAASAAALQGGKHSNPQSPLVQPQKTVTQLRSLFYQPPHSKQNNNKKKPGTNWSNNQLDDGELVIEVSRSHVASGGISHIGKWLVDGFLHHIYSWKHCFQIADATAWGRVPVRPVPFSSMLLSISATALVASCFAEHCWYQALFH